jgi:transcriptional regulator GlxA family with amidase domain
MKEQLSGGAQVGGSEAREVVRAARELNVVSTAGSRETNKKAHDDVRRNAARQYLATTDLSMTQIAGLVGLSEQSALTRCARRWWGTHTECDSQQS